MTPLSLGIGLAVPKGRGSSPGTAGGGPSGNGPDDEFDVGSTLDTAGTRYAGAYPWSPLNQRTGTFGVAGGQLTLSPAATVTNANPLYAMQALDSGDGAWRTKVAMSLTVPGPDMDFAGLGLALRESSTSKILCFGNAHHTTRVAELRRFNAPDNWTATIATFTLPDNDLDGYLEIVRSGSTLKFLVSDDLILWDQVTSLVQTTEFTTAPNEIGLWVSPNFSNELRSGTFDFFRKVTRAVVPLQVPLVNPGAESGVTGWTNVTNVLKTRAGTQRSGSNSFSITTTGLFEFYQEWDASAYATQIDAGLVTATLAGWGMPWSGGATTMNLRVNAYTAGGVSLGSASTGTWTPSVTYSRKYATLLLPATTRKVRVTFEGNGGSDDGWLDDVTLMIT